MADNKRSGSQGGGDIGGGLNGAELANRDKEDLGGAGGSSGGGTLSGAGEPSGGTLSGTGGTTGGVPGDSLGTRQAGVAAEAAALGSVDGSLADAAANAQDRSKPGAGAVGGETVGAGAGRGAVGSGTPEDTGDLGGGGGGTGPAGTASPGGDGRA